MGRTLLTAIATVAVGLLVGMGVGGFLAYSSTSKYIQSIPGAPIVVGAKYDSNRNALVLDIFNSGGLPVIVSSSGLVFKPAKGNGYEIANIPVSLTVPGGAMARVELKLKENTAAKKGDLISGTLVYGYPYIPQVFTTTFSLTVGQPYKTTPAEVMKKASKEAEKSGTKK